METIYWSVNPQSPEEEIIRKAACLLQQQELVAFPTETVYGVGAVAFSGTAVGKIFLAKARSERSPLLVHLSNMNQVETLVSNLTQEAYRLMEQFWPGPLSLILAAREGVPAEVRSGEPTVGLRMPSHPVARALIDISGPLAATSANLSGRPSPVSAADVKSDLNGRIAAVLDAGPTGSGLESTVLNLTVNPYCVLRRGGIAVEELEEHLGKTIQVAASQELSIQHYKTRSRIFLSADRDEFQYILKKALTASGRVGIVYNDLLPRPTCPELDGAAKEYQISLQPGSVGIYPLLRQAEEDGMAVLIFAPLPVVASGVPAAIMDRIRAAAASDQVYKV